MAKRPQDRPPYFRLYVDDFDEGVKSVGMTLEQEGFYQRFLRAQWRAQGPLFDNVASLAKLLRLQARPCSRLLEELVAMGPKKISRAHGLVWNPRLQREIDKYDRWRRLNQAPPGNPQGLLPLETPVASGPARRRSTGRPQRLVDIDPLGAALEKFGRNSGFVPGKVWPKNSS